ncbi:MAG TPA: Gldg family protein [Verrucomicrobiae bacterium]
MKNKKLETMLFSVAGVAAMFVILVALNYIAGLGKQRIDLTKEKLYTLSQGSKEILGKIDGQVEIRFYCTRGEKEMPMVLKAYAQRVEDLLAEYQQVAGKKLIVKKLDPKPDSDAEDSAVLDGVEGQMLQTGDKVFLGLAIEFVGQKVALPFLMPDRERLLEYDLSRAIAGVLTEEKPTVGIMTSLPIFGIPMNPMMAQMGQRGQDPWVLISELKQDFNVQQVEPSVEQIDEKKFKVLVVLHPKNLPDKTQYEIDQYVLRGGKLIVLVDPNAVMDSQGGSNPMMGSMPGNSSLDKLFAAWGITMESGKVIADMNYPTQLGGRGGQPQTNPAVLSLLEEALNKDDVITSSVDNLLVPFAGAIGGTPAMGLQQTVLVKSSSNSQMVEGFIAQMSGENIVKEFKSGGKELPLAVRLTGKFKTAFPDGKPKDAPAEAGPDAEKKAESKSAESLKEGKSDNAVIIVADVDWLYDQFCVQVQNFFGQRIVTPVSGNLGFFQNMVEQFAGDSSLIHVRSRASQSRPFTVMTKMEADANERFQSKIKELEGSLAETQKRLSELQQQKEKGQRLIMSPEQQQEIKEFRKKESEVNKQLKEERKKLRKDIDALQFKLKLGNIAGMPALVALFGIGLFLIKRKRTAAR